MSNTKVHKIQNKENLTKVRYRLIPYEELAELLRKDEEAFLESDEDRPLKRQTIKYAAKKLSQMIGKKVQYDRAVLRIDDLTILEGYSFSVEEQQSPLQSGSV